MKRFFKTLAFTIGAAFLLFSAAYSFLSLSQVIQQDGFTDSLFPDALAGFGSTTEDLFANYTTWPSSANLDPDDTVMQSLYYLYSSGQNSTLADINGDGLTDILLHWLGSPHKYGILLNNGNIGFDLVYKCIKVTSTTPPTWYGDCAGQ